jgi:hypothetical protein
MLPLLSWFRVDVVPLSNRQLRGCIREALVKDELAEGRDSA